MQHDITVDGYAFRLRPVVDADAPDIVALRSSPSLREFLSGVSGTVEAQLAWQQAYYQRPHDYYFACDNLRSGKTEGYVSVYSIDPGTGTGEWGRWVLKPGSLGAPECAWLIYRVAFDVLGLNHVYCRTAAASHNVVSFHDSCGIKERVVIPASLSIDGVLVDAVKHTLSREQWPEIRERLQKLSEKISLRIARA